MLNIICLWFLLISSLNAQSTMYDICPLKVSESIPDARVYNIEGIRINLKEYVGNKAVVLVFFRGGWCPYCTRHLAAIQQTKQQINTLGYEIVAITPDDFIHLDSSEIRSEGLDYTLLSDKDAAAMQAFGISWKVDDKLYNKYKDKYALDLEWWSGSRHHLLPVPAIYVIREGKVQYQYVNPDYSQRLSPGVLLSFLEN